jgi:uncharacterized protein (DUF697 family)/predicted GTPase
MLQRLKRFVSGTDYERDFQDRLARLRERSPIPVLWLFGKTQSGKTSIIRYLTGAADAEIGQGFRPCTRFSREYAFPTAEAPLLNFVDTRGVDEQGYDPREDLNRFNTIAHVVIVTVKLLDHALENVLKHVQVIRQEQPTRPILLALTCLHEAYPQEQHPEPYPYMDAKAPSTTDDRIDRVRRSMELHAQRFSGLIDEIIAVDLTSPSEGFSDVDYGGRELKATILKALPSAYRQTLLTVEEASGELQELFARRSLPHIAGYSTLAASAGAFPIPWLDLLILPGIQTRMIYHLARLYGQPLSATRFLELAGTLGLGILFRQGIREVAKLIPYVGSVAGGALAGASTFALGKAFCYYYSAVHKGHVPRAEDLKHYYREQLAWAERHWVLGTSH